MLNRRRRSIDGTAFMTHSAYEANVKIICLADTGEDAPTKCISEHVTLDVKCSITFIDFEGRSDGESMLKIVQQVKPREVILVRGDPKTTKRFAEQIKK